MKNEAIAHQHGQDEKQGYGDIGLAQEPEHEIEYQRAEEEVVKEPVAAYQFLIGHEGEEHGGTAMGRNAERIGRGSIGISPILGIVESDIAESVVKQQEYQSPLHARHIHARDTPAEVLSSIRQVFSLEAIATHQEEERHTHKPEEMVYRIGASGMTKHHEDDGYRLCYGDSAVERLICHLSSFL